jgi:hypothetical protein
VGPRAGLGADTPTGNRTPYFLFSYLKHVRLLEIKTCLRCDTHLWILVFIFPVIKITKIFKTAVELS